MRVLCYNTKSFFGATMLRAIIFDFDGVIVDSEPLHYSAFKHVLAEKNIGLTESQYYTDYIGMDDKGCFYLMDQE